MSNQRQKITKICQQCGKEFHPHYASKGFYCSRECLKGNNPTTFKQKDPERLKRVCECCSKEFYIINSGRERRFCSRQCWRNFTKGENHPGWTGDKYLFICQVCGKEFRNSQAADKKYCSNDCRLSAQKGETHWNYGKHLSLETRIKIAAGNRTVLYPLEYYNTKSKNPNRYVRIKKHQELLKSAPGKYTKEDVAQLKQKFNYKCACCGRSESDVQLTVDHIIPLARGGTNYLDNLQILCKSCNSRKRDRILVQPEVKNATQ